MAIFGSFSNGFKSSGSDLDIVYISDDIKPKDLVGSLNLLSGLASKYAFDNVTKIFQANVPTTLTKMFALLLRMIVLVPVSATSLWIGN